MKCDTRPFSRSSARPRVRLAFVAAFACLVPAGVARTQPAPVRPAGGIERELRSVLSVLPHAEARAGACVVDLDTGAPVFAENADTPLIPASTIKVFIMVTAIMQLSPEFSFQTVLASDGANLVVIGDGDPTPGDAKLAQGEPITADFDRWADTLRKKGITTIPGNLVIDESIFDDQWVHPSWEQRDLGHWYAAPAGGLNFNGNCVDITIEPADQPGAPVRVSFRPDNALVKIINECRTGGTGEPVLRHRYDTFEYRLSGRCRRRWPFGSVSFPDPGLLFAESLRRVLAKKGVRIQGAVRRRRVRRPDGSLPDTLRVLVTRTTPLSDVLRRIGKDSQNLFAECLLKRVGYEWARRHRAGDSQGSWPAGRRAVWDALGETGIDGTGLVIDDGSGLSRKNRCTARQLAMLLAWSVNKSERGRPLLQSLAVGGVDGSLRKRLKDIAGQVRAKTGTMRGVRALAGYVLAPTPRGLPFSPEVPIRPPVPSSPSIQEAGRGRGPRHEASRAPSARAATGNKSRRFTNPSPGPRYSFAIIFNGYKGPSTPYKRIQDRFCRILAGHTDIGSSR